MFDTPILFLIFNRPDTTEKVFERIREIKPKQLFIAADGPRMGNERDEINCKEARNIALSVDWDCEVKTLFREKNLGCGKAVSYALTWFFEHNEAGIILEDDTLPDLTFFNFCQDVLIKYSNNLEVMHIGGVSFQKFRNTDSYYFSNFPSIWGWATWKRAWNKFSYDISDYETYLEDPMAKKIFPLKKYRDHRKILLKKVHLNQLDTWDYRWSFCIWKNNGISVVPNYNLISNIGFGPNATHTIAYNPLLADNPLEKMPTNIKHPAKIKINEKADKAFLNLHFNNSFKAEVKKLLTELLLIIKRFMKKFLLFF